MYSFNDYQDAHFAAVDLARQCDREVGIVKAKEYGKTVYLVKHLPGAGHRYGWELNAEIVKPTDPY